MDVPLVNSGIPLASQTVVSPVTQTAGNVSGKPRDKRKTPAFLSNLGKATLRGIRKCPQCGVYNGTRGLSCKNKACGTIFRDGDHGTGRLKKGACEVVRVVTDSGGSRAGGAQVFSVRQRGRGSEQRGFVELVPTDTAITTADGTLLTRVNLGRCYMPSCQQNECELTVEGGHQQLTQPPKSPCTHVKQAMECQTQATPLPLKSSVLEALMATSQAKEELWRLATETPGPLVQRVSKGTLIVKCQPGEAHPLGLLHLTVGLSGVKDKTVGAAPFHCACYMPNTKGDLMAKSGGQSNVNEGENSQQHNLPEHCLHFYACVCAFTSDEKLASEFSAFLNYNMTEMTVRIIVHVQDCRRGQMPQRSVYLNLSITLSLPSLIVPRDSNLWNPLLEAASRWMRRMCHWVSSSGWPVLLRESIRRCTSSLMESQSRWCSTFLRLSLTPYSSVYHWAQRKEDYPTTLPIFTNGHSICGQSRNDGTLFEQLPLELTQSFVKNSDGSYSPYRCRETLPDPGSDTCLHSRTNKPLAIRPLELRTFLKVGTCGAEQTEPVPFVIEWIPDILPHSQVGELRIRFEYGHQLGSKLEHCKSSAGTERTEQTDTIPHQ
ncbi:uncharacterized protein C2orf42 homolog isoform X3 [Labeo rohita]|uniref:uncharacterized protein C2orf42 homolog isoform X3 n=1 Tax=Labeo rohita TaxID=84645 RepID=UPI0021E29BDD|nr:uncharacterized protein C2orf42 homolog isoform X3 [Labeo rohita]